MGTNLYNKIYGLARSVILMILFTGSLNFSNAQNYALTFDGSGDFVDFGSPAELQITGSQTIEMWIHPYSRNARRNPIAKAYGGEGTMTLETDGTINYFYGTAGSNNSPYQGFQSPAIPVNDWTHIALVRDLSAMKLYWYFNGVQVAVADAQFPNAQSGTLPFYIGRGYVSDFHGMLDDVRIWNIARSPSEIAAYKNAGLSGLEAGLAAYWPFDEGAGNTIMDNTPNGINGTRNGNTAFIASSAPVYPYSPGNEPFESVPPTGLPYNIVLSELTINGNPIPVGAQIGVFDGELCVGTAFYNGSPSQNLVAWQADPEQNLAGFTPGNPMTFKYHMPWHSEIRNFDAVKTMVRGNGNFGFSPFSVVNLAATTNLLPEINVSAEIINFNTVVVNQSQTLPLAFENNGTAILSITSIQNSVSNFVKSAAAFLIAPGAKDTLWITFTPTAVTSYSDILTFLTDDPDVPSVSVSLYGTGLPQPSAQIIVTPSSLNFGGIAMNTAKTMTFNILNPGNGNLTVTGISSSNASFTVLGSTSFTLGQGENRNVSVVFSPTQPGGFSGQLTIQNNAQNVILPVAGVASQGHFTSVAPTGKPYTILAEEIDIDGFSPKVGDEVAVFDDELCVGIGIAGGGGNSLQLNGSNGYVINNNSTAFDLQQLTISAWVFSSNFSQNGFIFEKGPVNSQYSLFFEGANINFRTYPSTGGGYDDFYVNWSSIGIQSNKWNHITATYNGVQKAIYVNGQLKASKAFSQPLRTGQAGQIIGAYGGSGGHSYFFNGRIDEVRVWSTARSVFEIQADMNQELKGNEPNLVGYWNFNDGNYNNLVSGSTPSYLVGNANLQGAQNPDIFQSMLITAWEKDDALGLPGFTAGNPMSFKVWTQIYDNWVEVAADPEYLVGNGNFGFGQMTVVNLDGTSGLAPDIFVPIESLYVGQVTVGSSVVNSVEISNQGNAPLHFTLSDNSAAFSTNISSGTIAPSESLEFQVTFTPTTAGGYSAVLLIQSNDPDEPEITINLEGFALPSGASNIATSVNQMNFGNVVMGSPVTLPIIVINTGTTALTVSNITFNNSAFTATPTSFTLQNTNDLKEVLVTFLPGNKGLFSGIMTIASNAPQKQVGVTGIGFEDHFNTVDPTGLPYTIIVKETNLQPGTIKPGDELAVFDNGVSVGSNSFSSAEKVLSLDGNGDFVEIPDHPSLDLPGNQITIESWIKTNSIEGDYRCILGKIGWTNSSDWSYNMHIADNGTLHFNFVNINGSSFPLNSPKPIFNNEWRHVAATYNGNVIKLYIDGIEVNSIPASGNIRQNNQPVKIGSWHSTDQNYFNGKLDEIRLWNYARTEAEIQSNMYRSLQGNETGLVGYWNFDSGVANDLTSNGNHGTLNGDAAVVSDWRVTNEHIITAWQKDVANGLPGFTPGNPMSFKLWTEINGFPTELTATPTYVVGNGNFGFGQFTVVNLEFGLPEISVDPMEIFVALEEPDSTNVNIVIYNNGVLNLKLELAFNQSWGQILNAVDEIAPGSNVQLTLKLNSTGLNDGMYSSNLVIQTNDIQNPIVEIPVSMNVTGNPQISASVPEVEFGQVVVNTSSQKTFNLKNIGTKDLIITAINVAGGNANGFGYLPGGASLPLTLVPGQSAPVAVEFTPASPGQANDMMVVESNAGNAASFEVALSGLGITPPEIFLPETAFSFSHPCNSTLSNSFIIQNEGQDNLAFTIVSNKTWLAPAPLQATVAGGENITINVNISTFDLFAGTHQATLSIQSNDPAQPVVQVFYTITITGEPVIVANDFINLGTTNVGETYIGQLTVANGGCDDLEVFLVDIQSQFAVFTVLNPVFIVPPGDAEMLLISFTPLGSQQYSGIITINSNDAANPALPIVVTATGVEPPKMSVFPLAVTTTLQSGDTGEEAVTVQNTGGLTLQFTSEVNPVNPYMVHLDGNGDYINVNHSSLLNPANALTLEAWVYLYDNTNEFIIGKENSTEGKYRFYVNSSSRFEFKLNNQFTVTSTQVAAKNQWYHVAATFDGSFMRIFVNGNLNAEQTFSPFTILPNTDNLRIGRSFQFHYFNGLIDEVRVWNIARNQSEIQSAMSQPLLGTEPELLLYFPFNSPSGNIVTDASTNTHNGIMFGDPVRLSSTVPFSDYLTLLNGSGNLTAGQQQDITLNLNSAGVFAGNYQRQIKVNSNAIDNPNQNVLLNFTIEGEGNLAPNPAQVHFENTFIGLKDTFELVVANTGATASLISGITFSNPAFYSLNTLTKVFPFSQKSLMLIFEPGQAQLFEGMLTITVDGSKSVEIQVPLSGLGVTPPVPVLNPLLADFGSVVVNHSESIGFTLGNSGSSALVVNTVTLSNNALFTTNLQLPLSLSFGQQTQFDITFTPVNYIPANAQMLLSTNIGQISIPLSGVGVPPDHDLAVTAILSPVNGCGLSNAEVLTVTIQNYGVLAQSNFNVGFRLNGGAQVVETFNGTLPSGQTVNYTFNQTLNLSAIGNFNLEASTLLGNDQNLGNDKLSQVIVNSPTVGAVTGLLPADGASGVVEPVVFSWAATPNTSAYDLYLWRTTQQKPATPTVAGITGTSHTYTEYINKNYIYNWQITARNQCSQSESAVQVFSFNVFSDLTVNGVVAPETANSGEFVDITFTVANIGTGGTGIIPWKDDIFLSLTPVFDAVTAVKVASVNNKNALNPGQSYTNMVNIKLGDYLEGSFYVFVVTDANNIIQETDETNNRLGTNSPMVVSLPPYPDITANNIQSLSGNIIPGQPLTVGWNVLNIGDAPAVGGWSQRIAIVSGSATQVLGFVQSSEALDPSGVIGLSASFNVPQQLNLEGDVFLQVRLTPNAALVEKPNGAANNTVLSDAALLLEKRLTISLPQPTLNENSTFPLNCMVYRSGNLSQSLTLTMSVSEENRVNIPASIIIPAGQAGAPFSITAIDNSIIEGNIALQIFADAPGYPTGLANLTIIDDETPSLALILNMTEASEGDIFQLTVTRDLVTANPLTVTLFTTKPNQITLPANIVIPANETSATIDIPVVQNTIPELTEDVVINATVAGYLPASATITILDDDLPQVTLTLNPTTVSEGGGPYASWGTVSLDQPANGNILVMITADPQGQLFFPAQVTIPNGQYQQQFNVGAVDNGILDGDRTVEITAAVFIASCGCGAPAGTGGADTKTLTILDNDGPSLSVSANPFVVPENLVNAGLLTITRNTLGGPAITVNIQHNRPTEIQIQPTVVIPEGETSVNVPFNTLDDGIEDGDQIVTLTVTSQDYSSGSCWIIVSDRNLPDYVAGNMSLSQNSILINDPVQISFTISNQGFALAGDGAEVKIFRSNDNVLSNDDLLLSTQYTNAVLSIGGSLQINYTYIPDDKVGDFFIIARVNGNGAKAELVAINNTTQAVPLSIVPDYMATVSVDGDVFNGTTPITITGLTETVAKSPAPFKAVDVYVVVNGARRLFNAVSDNKGEFTVTFVPINGEAGEYIVGACYPGQNLNDAQDNFTILGARPTATGYITWDIWLNETRSLFLEIQNFSGLDLNNLQLQVLSGPPGCAVNFTPVANLPGNSLATMSYSITANQITNGTQYEEVKLQLVSAEGTKYRFSAWFYGRATMGNLKLNPVSLNKTMVRGAINYAEFEVRNNGMDSTGVISVLLPQNNWMSLANNNSTIASLAPGQSAVVTLKLMPGEDLQLNNPITGQIALSGTNSNSVGLPFTFEPVSVETGNLLVDVVDEYTYNTEAAPHLEGATVIISHPYTGQIIAQGITDVNGHFLASDINEGFYNLRVSAPQHANHQSLVYVEKSVTTTKLVFIAFQAITYTWQVVPTMIEDEYEITLVAVFETNVPAPVVTMTMPDTIPQLNFGEVFPFILVMTNHGLITAKDVEVTFPEDDEYEFIANANMLDILPQTAVQIPVIVQRRNPNKSSGRSSNCSDFAIGSYQFECGPDNQLRLVMKTVYYKGRYCGGTGDPGGGGGWGWCWWCGGSGPGGPGGPGGGTVWPIEIPTVPYTQSNTGCDPCLAEFLNALWSCTPIPNIGIGSTQIGLDGKLSDAWQIIKPIKDLLKKLKCAWNIGWSIGCKINNTFFNKSMAVEGPPELVQAEEDFYYVDKGFAATENIALEVYNNQMLLQRESFGIFNDSVFNNIVAQTAIDAFRQAELLNVFTTSDIPQIEIQEFFSRWNTTMEAWNLGFYSPTPDYPNIIDSLLLYNYTLSYDTALNYAIGRGYSSIEALYNAAFEIVQGYTEQESSTVCATVTVQFSQMLTMTREAFEGTLTIFNGHESDAMENILLELEVKDENGFIRNDLFEIVTKSLNTITGINGSGTLDGQTEGSAVILFIPERGAAPDVPRFYSFGGKLSYLDPFTGEIFEQPLFPVTLQVNPSPDLYINYFMQRDIYGDDALTEPIEPMIPAELAVMIDNRGAGIAYSVNIESAQPEIIENEKGLLIDFNIVGSSLSGQPVQLGLLNVNFGDIQPGEIKVGQWWFTSTLLGHFISYEVSVNHLNSFGNPELSLISEVNVHELIKGVRVYGPLDDGIGDFLVNDIPDTDDIPDALYYSNGTVAPVYQANHTVVDGQVTLNDLETELTVSPSVSGWNFNKINDPGNGYFRIVSCTREDGQEIPLENIWLTYVTIPDGGEPIYENKLHFLDIFDGVDPVNYTIVWEAIDMNFPDVTAINGIPASGITDTPITNLEVVFNKPIDPATFDYEDLTLRNQGGPNLIDPMVTVAQVNDTTFNVDISSQTLANGFYVFTVQTAGIADMIGNYGQVDRQATWIQAISTPAIDYFFGIPQNGQPTDTLLVLFNMPINVSTFNTDQLILTGPDGNMISTSSLIITSESFNNVLFKISGLLPMASADGTYMMTFKVTEILGETGQAGMIDQNTSWTVCQIPLPTASIGSNATICIGESYQVNGAIQNASGFSWATSGTGTFSNPQILNPVYTPSEQDITNGSVQLSLTAQPLNDCAVAVTASMMLTIENAVQANAGNNAQICQNATHQLFGTVANASGFRWITSGNGTFNNPNILTPVYTAGSEDIADGFAFLSLIADPLSPCILADTSSVTLTIQALPTAYAGANQTICQDQQIQLQATATNYSNVFWVGGGSGSFNNRTILNPVYTLGQLDLERGYVAFLFYADALTPCYNRAFSVVRYDLVKTPIANAGTNATMCENQTFQLSGTANYHSSVSWETNGDGTFTNNFITNPIYKPGQSDIQNGSVQLVLTAMPVNPCLVAGSSQLTLTILNLPLADAGQDGFICEDQTFDLNGMAINASSVLWITAGDGTFSNAQSLTASYTPGATDKQTGSVELSLWAYPVTPCFVAAISTLVVEITNLPVVTAGADAIICEDQTYQLAGSAANAGAVQWTSSGDGSFDNENSLQAVYTPGAGDLANGTVLLTLTAQAVSPCFNAVSAQVTLTIQQQALATAGADASICEGESYQLSGLVANANTYYWQTSGDGTFDDDHLLNPVYTPGSGDIANESVQLTLIAASISPCSLSAESSLVLSVQPMPLVSAGDSGSICHYQTFDLSGNVENAQSFQWSSSGDGFFDDAGELNTTYTPGESDINNGSVILTLSAASISPCTVSVTDQVAVQVNYCHDLVIPSGWSGLSSFVNPLNPAMSGVFGDVVSDLIILHSLDGTYWPGQQVNTIGNWNVEDGYYIKVANQFSLTIAGSRSANSTLQLVQGWNLIPVLSTCEADLEALFAGKGVVVVKEVAGWQLFWPAYNINTLQNLQPGKAYFVLMANAETITFPGCNKNASSSGINSINQQMMEMINQAPWNRISRTAATHIIAIPDQVINTSLIRPGDYIGAFDQQGNCFGMIQWNGVNTNLTLFGNDPTTAAKDGFVEGENIYLKYLNSSTSKEQLMEVLWELALPDNDGIFAVNGLSAIAKLQVSENGNLPGEYLVKVYPNPAGNDLFVEVNLDSTCTISLIDLEGRKHLQVQTTNRNTQLDLSELSKGVYLLKIEGDQFFQVIKVIKQ